MWMEYSIGFIACIALSVQAKSVAHFLHLWCRKTNGFILKPTSLSFFSFCHVIFQFSLKNVDISSNLQIWMTTIHLFFGVLCKQTQIKHPRSPHTRLPLTEIVLCYANFSLVHLCARFKSFQSIRLHFMDKKKLSAKSIKMWILLFFFLSQKNKI